MSLEMHGSRPSDSFILPLFRTAWVASVLLLPVSSMTSLLTYSARALFRLNRLLPSSPALPVSVLELPSLCPIISVFIM